MRDLKVAIVPWVVARVLTLAAYGLAHLGTFRNDARPALQQGLLAWDAAFYAAIAQHGYEGTAPEALRFFPGLALLGRGVGVLPGIDARHGVVVVALIASLVFGMLLHRLVVDETGDSALATTAVWIALLAPNAFVLGMGYAEALFLAVTTGLFLALRADRTAAVAALGLFAGACRPVGVLLAVPVLVVAWQSRHRLGPGALLGRIAAAGAPGVGAVVYLAWVGVAVDDADFFTPLRLQNADNLRGGTELPGPNLVHALGQLVSGERVGYGLHVLSALVLVGLLVVCIRRLPLHYGAYAGATLLVGLSAHNLDSFERYAMAAFPFSVAAAMVARSWRVERVAVALSSVAFLLLAAASLGGRYLP